MKIKTVLTVIIIIVITLTTVYTTAYTNETKAYQVKCRYEITGAYGYFLVKATDMQNAMKMALKTAQEYWKVANSDKIFIISAFTTGKYKHAS